MDWPAALTGWFERHFPSADSFEIQNVHSLIAGASNESIALDVAIAAGGTRFTLPLVLRPERTFGILAPYDVQRQFRVMRALATTGVPVPAVLGYEPDTSILGVPFFLMARIEGDTPSLFWYGQGSHRLESAAAALAAIHVVDWSAAGLAFLLPGGIDAGTLPSPISCELAAWQEKARFHGTEDEPVLLALQRFLVANEPRDARHALLHGDPNAGNYLFRGDEVVAVLDWELAAIGDPRSDLGFYAALLSIFGGAPGDAGKTLLSDAYERITGVPLTDLAYYEALGLYRMLVITSSRGDMWSSFRSYRTQAVRRRLDDLLGRAWCR